MLVLSADNIRKSYAVPVLNGVSLALNAGDCIGIVGRNGCGKTTLLSILAGGVRADAGTLAILGVDAFRNRRALNRLVGYVPQTDPLLDTLSVKDNLSLWYALSGKRLSDDLGADGTVAQFGLLPVLHQRAGTLSGGMKRRVNLVGALAAGERVLVLDEPSGGLDLPCSREILHHLRQYRMRGGAIVIATHDRDEMQLCNRVYLLANGALTEADASLSADQLAWRMLQTESAAQRPLNHIHHQ